MSTAANPVTAQEWDRLQRGALIAGVTGLILCLVGALFSPAHFFRSYLVAFNFWLGIALGCLVILMLQYLTGGAWGILLRRVLEAGTRTLLLLAFLFVPLLVGLPELYGLTRPEDVAQEPDMAFKRFYLGVQFFVARAVVYFTIWLGVSYFLNKWSAEQDKTACPDLPRRFRLLSAPGLVLYGITITFASIDWVMSLEPLWFSTIYPVLFAVGQALEGMAFAVAVVILLAARPPLSGLIQSAHRRDLGNLLLMFVMFWAYMSFSQFLLIWAENLPEEIPWYLRRTRDGWQWVAILLILFQFGLPFLLLLSRDIKENPRSLAAVAVLVLAMRFLDVFWWVEAAFAGGMSFYWLLDLAAVVGLGGIWVWWFVWQLRQRPLLPLHDPYQPEYLPEVICHE
jgi:hypothetical protein